MRAALPKTHLADSLTNLLTIAIRSFAIWGYAEADAMTPDDVGALKWTGYVGKKS